MEFIIEITVCIGYKQDYYYTDFKICINKNLY